MEMVISTVTRIEYKIKDPDSKYLEQNVYQLANHQGNEYPEITTSTVHKQISIFMNEIMTDQM